MESRERSYSQNYYLYLKNPQDDILEIIANEEGIKVFRCPGDDVIQRLYDASKYYHLDYALNVTADCPLVSFEYIKEIIETFKNTRADLIRCHTIINFLDKHPEIVGINAHCQELYQKRWEDQTRLELK